MTLIIANWKAYITDSKKATDLVGAVSKTKIKKSAEVVICPPFIYLPVLKTAGAQDVFWGDSGAYTGQVSPLMLKNMKVKYVIVGHSERRNLFGENNELINKKIIALQRQGITPVLCVGENLNERKSKKTLKREKLI